MASSHPRGGNQRHFLERIGVVPETHSEKLIHTELLIIGGGPTGATAAIHAARRGLSTLIVDAQQFPRDKTCGDGLTPRAITQLDRIGLAATITDRYLSHGLKLHGFGGSVTAPWPDSAFGTVGSAMPRVELDALILDQARRQPEVSLIDGVAAIAVEFDGAKVSVVTLANGVRIKPTYLLVADGVRSTFGKLLGRTWHKGEVYGIAARSYCDTPRSTEPWIHSHLELTDDTGTIQPGYGWIFPLGDGRANVGCGALSTDRRPAKINTKKLLHFYAQQCRDEWDFGQPNNVASALLPMGGAVSNVAGANWMLIGDAAACVNPLNGEGIDYGMETAELAVSLLDEGKDFSLLWPFVLREHYGQAFLLARTAARLLTYPQLLRKLGPIGLKKPLGPVLMPAAARLMGNLVTEEDSDLVARAWAMAGTVVGRFRGSSPLWS